MMGGNSRTWPVCLVALPKSLRRQSGAAGQRAVKVQWDLAMMNRRLRRRVGINQIKPAIMKRRSGRRIGISLI